MVVEEHLRAVAKEVGGIAVVRVGRIHVAKGIIETFLVWIIGRQGQAESVFPNAGSQVSRVLEEPGDVEIGVGQVAWAIRANAAVAGVQWKVT